MPFKPDTLALTALLALLTALGPLATDMYLAALPLIVTMVVAMATAHSGFDAGAGGIEYPLTLAVVLASVAIQGPGRFTLPTIVARLAPGSPLESATSA